jgi:hypothetical protein
MKKQNVLIAIFVLAVGFLVWFLVPMNPKVQEPPARGEEATRVIEEDIKKLAQDETSEDTIVTSLVRLSYSASADAKSFVDKYLKHPSPRVRAAAVEAAGAFNDESYFGVIGSSLMDSEAQIRVSALKALGRHQGQAYEKVLSDYLKKTPPTREENTWGLLSLFRSSTDDSVRKPAALRLISMLDPDKRPEDVEVTLNALPIMPNDEKIIEKAKGWLKSAKDDEVAIKSFHYLASNDGEYLAAHLGDISFRKSDRFATVIKDFVGRKCPSQLKGVSDQLSSAQSNGKGSLTGINCQ